MFETKDGSTYTGEYYERLAVYEKSRLARHELDLALRGAKKYLVTSQGSAPVVLDIGCGLAFAKGRVAQIYPEAKYVGLERDEHVCSRVRLGGTDCRQGDAQKLSFDSETADIILMVHVIAHLNNPAIAVNEAFRVLKQGGLFIIITPNKVMTDLVVKPMELLTRRVHHDQTIIRQFRLKELRNLLADKFEIRYSAFLGWGLPIPGRLPLAPPLRFYGSNILLVGQKKQDTNI